MEHSTCSEISRHVVEPLGGTSPTATGWLLLEHAGPWPRTATDALHGDDAATTSIRRAAATQDVKVLLIRRPRHASSATTGTDGPTAFLVHAGATAWCEEIDPRSGALTDLDAGALLGAEPPRLGAARTAPLFLVCTHAKRDRCCATLGRPIADTLAALHPEDTWECSHLGGHRFAGNLLTLPDGFAYGNLDVAAALEVVTSTLAGRVNAEHLRGRVSLDKASQAADAWARGQLATSTPGTVRVVGSRTRQRGVANATGPEERREAEAAGTSSNTVVVSVEIDGVVRDLRVEHRPSGSQRRLSCDTEDVDDPGEYVVSG